MEARLALARVLTDVRQCVPDRCHNKDNLIDSGEGLTENSSRSIITSETGLAHTRAIAIISMVFRTGMFHSSSSVKRYRGLRELLMNRSDSIIMSV